MVVWDSNFEAAPADTDDAKYGANEIRELKEAIRERMELEHDFMANAQPLHKPGETSVCYVGNTTDIGNLANMANGAIAFDTTLGGFKVYDGNTWTLRRDTGYANDISNNANDIANNANDISNNANDIANHANDITTLQGSLDVIILQHYENANTSAGGQVIGSWATRKLNRESIDTGNYCALSSNQFTLDAGTYDIEAAAAFYNTHESMIRLFNVTANGVQDDLGNNDILSLTTDVESGGADIVMHGRFTIANQSVLRIESRVGVNNTVTGWGKAHNWGVEERYMTVKLQKIS